MQALGIHNVWLVEAPLTRTHDAVNKPRWQKRREKNDPTYDPLLGTKRAQMYKQHLDVRVFKSTSRCIEALRADQRQIWATDLGQGAQVLECGRIDVPARLAIVFGRECDGVSQEMLQEADRRVFLPMFGYTESFNLSVATALVMQRVLDACPEARGDLSLEVTTRLRSEWYGNLARSEDQKEEFRQLAASRGVEPFKDVRRTDEHRIQQAHNSNVFKRQLAAEATAIRENASGE